MQRYQVVVNGNTYTVTVKSLVGSTAIVDVDGWEFQVAVGEGEESPEFKPHLATAMPQPVRQTAPASRPPPPSVSTDRAKKRANALEQLALKKASVPQISGAGVVAAHLPGLIIEINVKEGDEVGRGDVVCKMEAMKMVNEVRAPIDGVVKEILVNEQQNVLENQPLLIIE